MAAQTQFVIGYERKFSDGNYGSEGMSLSLTVAGSDAELTPEAAITHVLRLRETVLSFLAKSEAPLVAHNAERELTGKQPRPVADSGTSDGLEELPF